MKPSTLAIIVVITIGGTGCETAKTLQATGGSRADATVELAYQYGMFEKPVIDWNQALATAKRRCQAWGYSNAEAFGGQTDQCQKYNGYGDCIKHHITVSYQCIGEQ